MLTLWPRKKPTIYICKSCDLRGKKAWDAFVGNLWSCPLSFRIVEAHVELWPTSLTWDSIQTPPEVFLSVFNTEIKKRINKTVDRSRQPKKPEGADEGSLAHCVPALKKKKVVLNFTSHFFSSLLWSFIYPKCLEHWVLMGDIFLWWNTLKLITDEHCDSPLLIRLYFLVTWLLGGKRFK